jgi:hypothetical protein
MKPRLSNWFFLFLALSNAFFAGARSVKEISSDNTLCLVVNIFVCLGMAAFAMLWDTRAKKGD